MEDINEIKQEEISISEHSSKKAMNGELIISCVEIGVFGEVNIRVSIPGRGKTESKVLKVGQAFEHEEKYFYKVTLLTINKKDNDNSIIVLVSKQKLQETPELKENIIQESETSRKRIFQELINKHCQNLPKCEFKYEYDFLEIIEKRFFKSNLIFFVSIIKGPLPIECVKIGRFYEGLFLDVWNSISIRVYKPEYFDNMIKVAHEYSQITGKKANVVKNF